MTRWLSIAVLVLACASLLGASVRAEAPTITISPNSGPCGTLVQVQGHNFPPTSPMTVVIVPIRGGGELPDTPTTTTDGSGNFTVTVQLRVSSTCPWPEGTEVVACVFDQCPPRVTAPFNVVTGVPSTGTGVDHDESHSTEFITLLLAGTGALALVLARKISRRSS